MISVYSMPFMIWIQYILAPLVNIALGSAGEVYSQCYACYRAGQFSETTFDAIDVTV